MQNVERVVKAMRESQHSLDVGGWHKPINGATHVLDINSYESRLKGQAWDLDQPERFTQATWTQLDICDRKPWPYPDKYFDFVCCSHVLEDIRDPIWVVSELSRVGRAGYIECPSAAAELLIRQPLMSYLLHTDKGTIGCAHHRWLVEFQSHTSSIIFRLKPHDLMAQQRAVRFSKLHAVDYANCVSWLFWHEQVSAQEEIFDIGEWIDTVAVPEAHHLVSFAPIQRAKSKLQAAFDTSTKIPTFKQPNQGEGCKYPYF